jgi:C-terminal processing protease CtpA/Prc
MRLLLFAFRIAIFGVFVSAASAGCASAQPGTIGAALGKRTDGRLFVRRAPFGQAADKAGIEVDDEIIAIDGRPVKEMGEDDVRKAVRGDVGSTLLVTVEHEGKRRDVKVQRTASFEPAPEKK